MIKNGTVFAGRYEIIERIGSGGMADVYKAHDSRLKRDVAIKVLKASLAEDADFVEKFRTEGEAAASLTNANVVSVYDVGNVGSTYYIVMELIDGITLKDYIRRKGMLSSRETMAITAQVAVGLRAAHARHIVHRDIKPQNIILSRDGKVKVTDFGIARGVTDETRHGQKAELGSVHYIAPEQAKGQPCDERSDIYSLGIVMYEMITGRVPFDKDTQVAVALAHMNETMIPPSEINPDCPVALEQIIFRATQKSKERRYHNCTELLQDLKIAVNNPSFNFEKQEQESVLRSTTQVFTGTSQAAGMSQERVKRPARPAFQPNVPAVSGAEEDDDGMEDDSTVVAAESGTVRRQAMTIIDSEEEKPQRGGIRERRSSGPVIDFTELSPDTAEYEVPEESGDEEAGSDLFAEDAKEDEKTLMDRIVLIAGIVIGAIIICLLIYIFVTLSGCNQSTIARPDASTGASAEVGQKETAEETTEEIVELSTKESDSFDPDTDAVVPNVLGLYFEEAMKALQDAGLEGKIGSEFGYSDEYPELYIMKQSYPEGTIVEKGSTIVIMMSQGSDKFEIRENFAGGTLTAFKNEAVNFPDVNFVYESSYSDTVPANHIISITPASGFAQPGDTVTVVYSLGAEYVEVPNLVGSYKSEVATKLMYSALTAGTMTEANNDDVPEGLVISQNPGPGSRVKNGSTVDVIISLGPKMEQVPDVLGKNVEEAKALLTNAGFTVETADEISSEAEEGTVLSQSVAGGEYAPLNQPITLVVAKAENLMPDLTLGSLEDAKAAAASLGFTIGKTDTEATDDESKALFVKSQSVAAGTVISADEPPVVDLVYYVYEEAASSSSETETSPSESESSSETAEQVDLDNYVGSNYVNDGIEGTITALGLVPKVEKIENTEGEGKTNVIAEMSPAGPAKVNKGSEVVFKIYGEYKAPESSETPSPETSETATPATDPSETSSSESASETAAEGGGA